VAAPQCNFSEKALDLWVRDTLQTYTDNPALIPKDGDAWLRDRGGKHSIPGLYLRLRLRHQHRGGAFTTEDPSVAFYLVRKIAGRKRSLRIGDRATYTVVMARKAAKEEAQDLSQGHDRRAERRKDAEARRVRQLSYRDALEAFLDQADVTDGTKAKYRLSLTTTFKAVADMPMAETFTERRVKALHKARSAESPSRADQDFRVLRLLWNWVQVTYQTPDGEPLLGPNPVPLALNKQRAAGKTKAQWNAVPRRATIIPEKRLGDWFQALYALRDDPDSRGIRVRSCDLLEALVLTGLRFNELAKLTWERVDLDLGTLAIPGPLSKNGRPLVRPITRRVGEILARRKAEREALGSALVFPGRSKDRPIRDPRTLHAAIQERTGLAIVAHDLRRVYSSAALRAGVPQLTLKRLLNHTSNTQEVTEGYQITDLGYLHTESQRIEDSLLGAAGLLSSPGMDAQLLDLLSTLPEAAKQRLLLDLSERRAEGVANG